MKIITQEESDAQQRATLIGGAKGFFGGLAVAIPLSYILHKRWPYYRALPLGLKGLGVTLVAVPAFIISAERASLRFERERWGREELEKSEAEERARWEQMPLKEKIQDFAVRHEYGLIAGGWAATMVGSFAWIMRDPYQSLPQKIVQARMWAQGLTIGVVLAAAALTHSRRAAEGIRQRAPDHSWQEAIQKAEQAKAARAAEGKS